MTSWYSVSLPFGAVGWSTVCVLVIPDHTHLLFEMEHTCSDVSNIGHFCIHISNICTK